MEIIKNFAKNILQAFIPPKNDKEMIKFDAYHIFTYGFVFGGIQFVISLLTPKEV